MRTIPPPDDVDVEVTVGSPAPAGAPTGTSATVVVALLEALDRLSGNGRPAYQIAYDPHAVETRMLGGESGIQDQLCAAFGGINFIDIIEYPRAWCRRSRFLIARARNWRAGLRSSTSDVLIVPAPFINRSSLSWSKSVPTTRHWLSCARPPNALETRSSLATSPGSDAP